MSEECQYTLWLKHQTIDAEFWQPVKAGAKEELEHLRARAMQLPSGMLSRFVDSAITEYGDRPT